MVGTAIAWLYFENRWRGEWVGMVGVDGELCLAWIIETGSWKVFATVFMMV